MLVAFLANFSAVGLFAFLGMKFPETLAAGCLLAVFLTGWTAITVYSFARFGCPRCGEDFAGSRGFWSKRWLLRTRKCLHCDLKQFASDDSR